MPKKSQPNDDGPRKKDQDREMYGGWEIIGPLGKGGNGSVRRARKGTAEGALKILHKNLSRRPDRRQRFMAEIRAMQLCADIPRVLPIIDAVDITQGDPGGDLWLVTEVAARLEDILDTEAPLDDVVFAAQQIAETLAEMHDRGIPHRDIKPDNLFFYKGRWTVGDFGLADFPNKKAVTQLNEKLGPMFYIAPEMINNAAHADGRSADVYSLAKTVFKLASGMRYPLPGQHFAHQSVYSLNTHVNHPRAVLLNTMLEAATDIEPSKRPTMKDLANTLREWSTPPIPNSSGPISLDLSEHTDAIAEMKELRRIGIASYTEQSERRAEINSAWIKPISEFIEEIRLSLHSAGLDDVQITEPNNTNCHGVLHYSLTLKNGIQGHFNVVIAFYADEVPLCKLLVEFQHNFTEHPQLASVLTRNYQFLGNSPDEHLVWREARHFIRESLQDQLTRFISKVRGRRE